MSEPAVRLTGIDKSYGSVRANAGATLEVRPGEVHALVGENGAGKSTLMRILSGMEVPDAGRVEIFGRAVTGWSTAQAIEAGVGMVHQHFMLVSTLTVAENLVLGREPRRGLQLDLARARDEVDRLVTRTGLRVAADRRVGELGVGEAQRVEILKALYRGARVLILDEPTAVLSPPEVAELWKVLRRLRDEGATVILITHRLDEVMAVSDAITVMRDGATVRRMETVDTRPAEIARAMVGRDVKLARAGAGDPDEELWPSRVPPGAQPLLEVRELVVRGRAGHVAVDGVSLQVLPGEILGIAGVEGNGQAELVEAITGILRPESGSVLLEGRDVTGASVRARGDAGLAHVPEDRHHRGLLLDLPLQDNLILGLQHRFTRGPLLDRARMERHAREQIAALDVRPPDPSLPARSLSGGNQQKVVIAREMSRDFRVLVAAQPTRGVDVGAVEQIHERLRDAREAGRAVLLVSAELSEVLALSDRVAVMYDGRFAAVLPRAECSEETLGSYMTGARREEAA